MLPSKVRFSPDLVLRIIQYLHLERRAQNYISYLMRVQRIVMVHP